MNRKEIILQELNENPDNPFNYYLLAVEERSIGNLDKSTYLLQSLIERFPDYYPTYYTLAEIFYQLDRTEEATAIATLGIKKAKDLQLMKVLRELEQLILVND